jgi:hypothetical protein
MNALIMEAVRISETSINFNMTRRLYIPEDSTLGTLFFCSRSIFQRSEVFWFTMLKVVKINFDV